jgi:hypothetical protein
MYKDIFMSADIWLKKKQITRPRHQSECPSTVIKKSVKTFPIAVAYEAYQHQASILEHLTRIGTIQTICTAVFGGLTITAMMSIFII